MYLWDVKGKSFDWTHIRWNWTLCQATLGNFGLGFDFCYSANRVTHRYKRGFWVSFKLLWIDFMVSADWGNKAATDAAWEKAFAALRAESEAAKL